MVKQFLAYVELELFESTTHCATSWTLCYASTRLFRHQCFDTTGAETANAFCASETLLENTKPPTACAVYLDGVREHW
jgi:hypothetical protein